MVISLIMPYDQYAREGRLLENQPWEFYNGYNVTFRPKYLSPDELLDAHRQLWRRAFSPSHALGRIARGRHYLRSGALLMSTAMNGFYGLKRLHGNEPVNMARWLEKKEYSFEALRVNLEGSISQPK